MDMYNQYKYNMLLMSNKELLVLQQQVIEMLHTQKQTYKKTEIYIDRKVTQVTKNR